ncbi:hypothetical protein NDU88_005678 [Pleurodeles waltl]|uniref:Uncharacterized protein n=1 Tax=Pleurodeles waltl TaxID=8319 RepID=A0AAV7WVD0_PLEWA|nr:hypothetical protein NDU88_005678 [Pleurodeles waltl]
MGRTCSSGSMASWFFVECREVSGFRSKYCFCHALDGVGTAPKNLADGWVGWGGRYIVFRLSVDGYRCGVCCYRRGGRSVKVAVYVASFRRGRDPIF